MAAATSARRRLAYTAGALGLLVLGGAIFAMASASGKADPHVGGQPSTEPADVPPHEEDKDDDVAAVDMGSLPKAEGRSEETDGSDGDSEEGGPDEGDAKPEGEEPAPTAKPAWVPRPVPGPLPAAKPDPQPESSESDSWNKQDPGF
jgi:hypothetical protein